MDNFPLHVLPPNKEQYIYPATVRGLVSSQSARAVRVAVVGSSTLCEPHVWRSLADSGKDSMQPIRLIVERESDGGSSEFDDPLFCDDTSSSRPETEAVFERADDHGMCTAPLALNPASPMEEDGVAHWLKCSCQSLHRIDDELTQRQSSRSLKVGTLGAAQARIYPGNPVL